MTNEQFAALVARLEQSAIGSPGMYRLRVLGLALLGNAYMLFILLLIATLFLISLVSIVFLKALALKIIIPVAIILWAVIKSLWVKVPDPQGLSLQRKEAPELFRLIDALQKRAGAPRFHRVLITDDFNAAVAQRPRLGIFGGYRNFLLIGLPLMKMLTVEQFTAVLAHEFGHLARGHGRLSNWVYRQRQRWSQLMGLFGEDGYKGSFLFTPFLNRFAPYFNAYSFPLARANEYEADAAAVAVAGKSVAAEALTAAHVVSSYLDEQYWPQIYRKADDMPQPAFAPYHEMQGHLAADVPGDTLKRWLDQAMQQQTGLSDTHPSLKDRLDAFGEKPRYAPPQPGQSAEKLLGEALGSITARFDRDWITAVEDGWKKRFDEVHDGREALAQLEQKSASGELSLQEAYDRAILTERFGAGADAALALFEALQQRAPEDAVICYALGVRWLGRNDERGVALLQFAMEHDAEAYVQGAEALRDYYWSNDKEEEAHQWHNRMLERAETDRLAAKERDQILITDKYDRHGLDEEAVAALRTQLDQIPGLRKVYLVRKRLKHYPERPLFVLGFTVRFWTLRAKKLRKEVQQHIVGEVEFPGQALIICVEGDNYKFGRKFFWMRGSRIK